MNLLPFPVFGLRLMVQFERQWQLPPFPGSLLRGVFGAALRQLSCMTGFHSCDGCPLRATCPYPELFSPPPRDLQAVGLGRTQQGLPPPFLLRVPEGDIGADGQLEFGVRLVGHGVTRLHYVVEAWRRALARGLGHERVRGLLLQVADEATGKTLWQEESDLSPPSPLIPKSVNADLALLTRTPLRLKWRGTLLSAEDPTPRLFIAGIIRRARLLAIHGDEQSQKTVRLWPVTDWLMQAENIGHQPQLVQQDWYRWSARQKQRMNLGGLVGRWAWQQVPEEIGSLLALGSLLHVGKEASFGLGAYDILAN